MCCQVIGTNTGRPNRAMEFSSEATQPRSDEISTVCSSSAAAAVQRQPYLKLLPLCQSSPCTCLFLVHSRRSCRDNIFTSNSTIKHTSSDLMHAMSTKGAAAAKKAAAHFIPGTCHWNACVHHVRLSTPPGHQVNLTPRGNLVRRMIWHALHDEGRS